MNCASRTTSRGFTLIELITVIIVIGIMLGVALPKYMQMAEKTKASNAKRVLDILRKSEEAYYAENSEYADYTEGDDVGTGIVDEIPQAKIEGDADWIYSVVAEGEGSSTDADSYIAYAERERGPEGVVGKLIGLDNDGNFKYYSAVGTEVTTTEMSVVRKNWGRE